MFWILLTLVICALSYYWYVYEICFSALEKLPGPPRKFLLGNVFEFGDNIADSFKELISLPVRYGPLVRIWLGPFRRVVVVTDPSHVEYFLSSTEHIEKSPAYDNLKHWLGNGLIKSSGEYWKNHRRIITPTFHFKILEEFAEFINTNCHHFIEILSKNVNCDYNISPIINLYSLDVICETAMNVKLNVMDNENSDYVKHVKKYLEIHINRNFSLFKQSDTLFQFTSDYKERQNCVEALHKFTDKVIKQRKEERSNIKTTKNSDNDELGIRKKTAFLDLLLDVKDLTDKELREEVDTFMFAGHDTISTSLSFALFELAKHPDIQERLYEESIELLGSDKHVEIKFRNIQEMKYLDMVVKECLRINTTVPFIERQIKRTVTHNNVEYPSGTIISLVLYAMHKNPEYFPNPDVFDPERFLPDNTSRRHPFAYIPFSAGPRNCIGQRFAILEMKLTIINIIRQFKLSPVVPTFTPNLANDAVLKSLNGLPVILKLRH